MSRFLRSTAALSWLVLVFPLRGDEVLRIMAGNLTSGNGQDYDPGEGGRIFKGLHPDVALVQEMNYLSNTPANYRAWVDANFGTGYSYFVQSGSGIQLPNGIVSRYPILASGIWDDTTMSNRDYSWARIDIPGDKDLWAVSVHISSGGGSSQRAKEAAEIRSYIQANVPSTDYLVIGGDLNTTTRGETCVSTFSSVVVTTGPYPTDQSGNENTNSSRAKPYDWVLPDADLNALKTPLVIGTASFPSGLVFDSRVFVPLAAVSPVASGDSSATGMQHMGVIRAFLIPTNDPPLVATAASSTSKETVLDPDGTVRQIVRGKSIGLAVVATDDGGEAALKYTWRVANDPAGATFSSNGTNAAKNSTVTFSGTGDYTLAVTVQDVPGLAAASSVKLRVVQTTGGLALAPSLATLAVNETRTFTATLLDQFQMPMAAQPANFTQSTTGGGTIDTSGVFTATTAGGPFTVSAAINGFSATASVTVVRANASVTLTNLTQTYDGTAKPITVSTTPAGREVVVLYAGTPVAPTAVGSYAVSATISDPNYQGAENATLVISPDAYAVWKNQYFTAQEQATTLADDLADADFDGFPNLVEYALGADPRTFTPPLSSLADGSEFSLTFSRPAALQGIHYIVESSPDLGNWTSVPLEIITAGAIETVRAAAPGGGQHFLRLRIERQ